MISDDEGLTWGRPQRLISSPLINLSTLVKSPAIVFADGRLGLPAYHEWIGRFGEFLRVDASQVIDKRRMSSGRGAIQPAVFTGGSQEAEAFFRQTRPSSQLKQIPVSETKDAGQSWAVAKDLEIPNPNSALAALTLANGTRVMVLNNIESARYRLVMVMRESSSSQWQVVQVLEDDESLLNDQHREFSYPFLISANGEDAHLTYTWNRTKIKHVYFPATWFKQAASNLKQKEVQ
jgi:predicted neuraminidase